MNQTNDPDYTRGDELLQSFVRGDALIGLIADVPGAEKQMMDALWAAAGRGHAGAWTDIGDAHIAQLRSVGAYDGVEVDGRGETLWSEGARRIVDGDQPQLECALRSYYEAHRLGNRAATMHFAKMCRYSNPDNKRIASEALAGLGDPTPGEIYQLGLVQNWLGEMEASANSHLAAAERGDHDAQFELYIYFTQGVGVEADPAKAWSFLERAAAGNHPRALFNVGATYATGKDGAAPDKDMAASYYERAAEHGNARAAATLGVMILTREIDGTKAQAIAWLDRADAGGHDTWASLDYAGVDDPREPAEDDERNDDEADA